ncbi:MAG TPA: hypothetical protein VF424_15580, partial [Vicinamibacterales bacterium]
MIRLARWITVTGAACWPILLTPAVDQQAVFREGVASVFVNVSVTQGNVPVAGLGAEDFVVQDNGARQKVDTIDIEAIPIDLTLFHDTSMSQAGRIEGLKDDVIAIARLLRPGDRIRVLTLGFQITDVFGWQPAGENLDLSKVRLGANSAA